MRSCTVAFAIALTACATGQPTGDDDDGQGFDARQSPDSSDQVPIDAADPDSMTGGGEVTAQEALCNDGFDNDSDGQTDCVDTTCAWACTALGGACTTPSKLRAYSMTPMPQTLPDVSSINAMVVVAQTGTITVAAVRFNVTHGWTEDLDLTARSPANTNLDLTSDNGGGSDNYTNTVFIDSAGTGVTSGSAPFTGNFRPEAALSGWNGQSITGSWQATLTDDESLIAGTWTELSLGFCVSP
jgi:hypothetical protein